MYTLEPDSSTAEKQNSRLEPEIVPETPSSRLSQPDSVVADKVKLNSEHDSRILDEVNSNSEPDSRGLDKVNSPLERDSVVKDKADSYLEPDSRVLDKENSHLEPDSIVKEKLEPDLVALLEKQNSRLVSEFRAVKLETEAKKSWDLFYKRNQTKFFKDRHWTTREFQELLGRDVFSISTLIRHNQYTSLVMNLWYRGPPTPGQGRVWKYGSGILSYQVRHVGG
jgi:hypothetical protein